MSGPEAAGGAVASAQRLSDSGDHVGALAEADRAIALDPSRADAFTARGWALENLGYLVDAREAYREAVRRNPGEIRAKEGLSNVLRRLGLPAEADVLAAEVVVDADARGDDAEALELKGWCEYRLERFEDAETSFRRALELDTDALAVRLDLALVLLCAGRGPEALETYGDGLVAARRSGGRAGLVAVALDDLDDALEERPELRGEPSAVAARAILAGFGDASSGSGSVPMGGP